jgi:hypothetical protein
MQDLNLFALYTEKLIENNIIFLLQAQLHPLFMANLD